MVFVPKDWQDWPSQATPITADALKDLEQRVADSLQQSNFQYFGVAPFLDVDGSIQFNYPPTTLGIDVDGHPYYNPAGATPGEEAYPVLDVTGDIYLVQVNP